MSPPRIISQTGIIFGGQILSAAIVFVTTPVIALGLGTESYGLYTLLFLLLGYTTALDFGLSFALVKLVAEYDPQKDRAEIDSLVDAASAVYVVIAGVFVFTLLVGRGWIATRVLHAPEPLVGATKDATVLLACSVPFATAATVFGALLRGMLRFDVVALFSIANTSLYAIGAALSVKLRGSLVAVIGVYAAVTAVSCVTQWAVLRRLLPGFRPIPQPKASQVRRLFSFGSFMALNQVGLIALLQLDRMVIARVLSVSMAGYYAVPFGMSQRLNMLGAAASTVAFPHSSASIARGKLDDFRHQRLQSARVIAWLTLAPTLVVIVFADQMLRYWMSPEFATHGALPLRLLAFGTLWISIASLDAVSIEGSGRPWVTALFMGITGLMNIVGLLLLTPALGLRGAALSVTASLCVLAALDVWYCSRKVTHSSLRAWGRSVLLPAILTILVSLPVLLLARAAVAGLTSLVLVAMTATAFACVIGYWAFLPVEDRSWIRTRLAQRVGHARALSRTKQATE